MLRQCPFWINVGADIPRLDATIVGQQLAARRKLVSVFPGVISGVPRGQVQQEDIVVIQEPLFINLACLCEDHRTAFYASYPMKCNSRQKMEDGSHKVAMGNNRHVLFRNGKFVYCHARSQSERFEKRTSARYNSHTWLPLHEIVAHHLPIVSNIAVHPSDVLQVRLVSEAMSRVVNHFDNDLTRLPPQLLVAYPHGIPAMKQVLDVIDRSLANQSEVLTMMGETLTCYLVPSVVNESSHRTGKGNVTESAVGHFIPLAFMLV